VAVLCEQVNCFLVIRRFAFEALFPGGSIDRCVPEYSSGVALQTESDEATAHSAIAIKENDV
jgi:hypothetical protein